MRTKILLSTLSVTAALAAGAALLPALAQPTGTAPADQAQGLTEAQVRDRLAAAGYGGIEKLERRRDRFEVYTLDKDARRVELKLDARTGEVIESEFKRDKSDKTDKSDRSEKNDKRAGERDRAAGIAAPQK